MYNGVRLKPFEGDLFSLKEKLFLDEQSRILLMLAVYELGKGYEFMFKVMSLLFKEKPDIHLVVCGDGSDEEFDHINNMRLNSSCPDNIHLMKFQKNIQSMLLESELLVMPSQEYESFGYAAVEAMLCKRAVIVTDVGGLPEVVKDGETGYVVNKDDYRLFLKSIIDLLDNDQKKADFSENGFLRAKSIFSPDRMSREYCKLVHDLDSLDFIKK
jgi:glycosyltransferase involved in cell wall biosynthesis